MSKPINPGYDYTNSAIGDAPLAPEPDVSEREFMDRLLEIRIKRLEQEIARTGERRQTPIETKTRAPRPGQ